MVDEPQDPMPKLLADLDQFTRGIQLIAKPMAAMFKALREEGLGIAEAATMTGAYFAAAMGGGGEDEE